MKLILRTICLLGLLAVVAQSTENDPNAAIIRAATATVRRQGHDLAHFHSPRVLAVNSSEGTAIVSFRSKLPKFINNISVTVSAADVLATPALSAASISELSSPSQQVRDDAAKVLRDTFTLPPRARWDHTLAAIRTGDSKESVLKLLHQVNATVESLSASGQTATESYRLDDAWVLACSYQRAGSAETVIEAILSERLRNVWVAPPPHFTGVWTTYFVNGQRSHEIHYARGRYFGVFTAFHSDGSKSYVQHYDSSGANGEDTGYFPSGRVSYRARYKNDSPIGTWTHYNEDGSVRATEKHPERNN